MEGIGVEDVYASIERLFFGSTKYVREGLRGVEYMCVGLSSRIICRPLARSHLQS